MHALGVSRSSACSGAPIHAAQLGAMNTTEHLEHLHSSQEIKQQACLSTDDHLYGDVACLVHKASLDRLDALQKHASQGILTKRVCTFCLCMHGTCELQKCASCSARPASWSAIELKGMHGEGFESAASRCNLLPLVTDLEGSWCLSLSRYFTLFLCSGARPCLEGRRPTASDFSSSLISKFLCVAHAFSELRQTSAEGPAADHYQGYAPVVFCSCESRGSTHLLTKICKTHVLFLHPEP